MPDPDIYFLPVINNIQRIAPRWAYSKSSFMYFYNEVNRHQSRLIIEGEGGVYIKKFYVLPERGLIETDRTRENLNSWKTR